MKRLSKILIVGMILVSFSLLVWYMLLPVTISNVYLDNEENFYFTLMNNRNEAADLSYKWHLDDPKAKLPVYSGTGKIRLDGKTSYDVVEQFIPRNDYDQRFYIMNVEIFKDGSRVASYTKQKSPYDWNYTVLPPVRT